VKRLLLAALSVGLTASQGLAAQSARDSIQGVWRVVEATITGPQARTIAFAERPNLTLITARHYSRVEVQADGPRPILADVAKASADELRAVLTGQDARPWPHHVTIQNKVEPDEARRTLASVQAGHTPYENGVEALALWHYRGGPWEAAGGGSTSRA